METAQKTDIVIPAVKGLQKTSKYDHKDEQASFGRKQDDYKGRQWSCKP